MKLPCLLPLSRLRERVANAEGVSRERAFCPTGNILSPPLRGDPLPQAGEGKEGTRSRSAYVPLPNASGKNMSFQSFGGFFSEPVLAMKSTKA